ncbi:hypothetical protein [Kitasatospora sp. NPDC088779]
MPSARIREATGQRERADGAARTRPGTTAGPAPARSGRSGR